MEICGLHSNSLHPPALSDTDDDAATLENLPYILLELEAYVAEHDNAATTAFSTTCDGKRVQVTLFPRRPPRVSYVCVHSPDGAEINMEPTVLAAEGDIILLRLTVGAKGRKVRNIDYYVYRAGGGGGGAEGPSFTLLPRPPTDYPFDSSTIGILRYSPAGADNEAYVLAGENKAQWWRPEGEFDFCLYDSKQGVWKTIDASLSQEEMQENANEEFDDDNCEEEEEEEEGEEEGGGESEFYHDTCKVMAVGGDAGTVAFVDLWRGIVFCDVLAALDEDTIPELHYVKLPRPLQWNKTLKGEPRLYRNIAVVGNRIKYVELAAHHYKQRVVFTHHYKESVVFVNNQFVRNGWMAATWSRPANSSSSEEDWREDNRVMDSRDVKVDKEIYFKMLSKVQNDEGDTLSPSSLRLDFCQPVLSLGDGGLDVIYFTAKRNRGDANGLVMSVDLENKELLDVASFFSERNVGINLAFIHSSISSHLKSLS